MAHQSENDRTAQLLRHLAGMRSGEDLTRIKKMVEQLETIRIQEGVLSMFRDISPENLYDELIAKLNGQNNALWRGVRAQGYEVIDELRTAISEIFGPAETAIERDMKEKTEILTDFAPISQVCLAYPSGVKEDKDDYSPLTSFYDELLELIPTDVEVLLFVKTREIAQAIYANGFKRPIRCVVHNGLKTIWLRDAVGFNLGTRLVKPITPYSQATGESMSLIHSFLNLDLDPIELVWEGGNLVTNGRVGFISNKLKQRNQTKFPDEAALSQHIREKLGIEPIWVDLPRADKLSHTDGYMTFISPNQLLVSTYPTGWHPDEQACVDKIAEQARAQGLEVIRIPDAPVDSPVKKSTVASAEGIYINFLQINNTWLIPKYNKPDEQQLMEQLKRLNPNGSVVPIDCTELAEFGGVLHCISFCN